jgi:hypothetical protein
MSERSPALASGHARPMFPGLSDSVNDIAETIDIVSAKANEATFVLSETP